MAREESLSGCKNRFFSKWKKYQCQ